MYVCQDRLLFMPVQIWTVIVDKSLQAQPLQCRQGPCLQMDSHTIPVLRHLVIWQVAASLLGCDIHVLLMENPHGDTTTQLS